MTQLSEGGRDRRSCNRLNTLTFALTYLLIRGAACFLIRMQQLPNPISANWREVISKAFSTGRKPWAVMISTALLAGFGMGLLSGFISDRFFDVSTHRITKEAWMQTAVGRIIAVKPMAITTRKTIDLVQWQSASFSIRLGWSLISSISTGSDEGPQPSGYSRTAARRDNRS